MMSNLLDLPTMRKANQQNSRMLKRHNIVPYLIYPENKNKGIWDLIMTFVLLISCVITPLDIAFDSDNPSQIDTFVKVTIDVLFCIDIIVCFFTAYYNENDDVV